jgi:hypothetical protein
MSRRARKESTRKLALQSPSKSQNIIDPDEIIADEYVGTIVEATMKHLITTD